MVFGHTSYVNELKPFPSLWSKSFATACGIKTTQEIQTKSQEHSTMLNYKQVSNTVPCLIITMFLTQYHA